MVNSEIKVGDRVMFKNPKIASHHATVESGCYIVYFRGGIVIEIAHGIVTIKMRARIQHNFIEGTFSVMLDEVLPIPILAQTLFDGDLSEAVRVG